MLLEMLDAHKSPYIADVNMKTIPKLGYIAIKGNMPIAAGFMRKTEGNMVGIFDGMVSNPYCSKQLRHEGFTTIFNNLVQDAKDLKLLGLIAFTSDDGMANRLLNLKFDTASHTMYSLNLRNQES